jgi:hypothetical protein
MLFFRQPHVAQPIGACADFDRDSIAPVGDQLVGTAGSMCHPDAVICGQ